MATISKRGDSWRVQIRRRGVKPITRTFRTKAEAARWALEWESRIETGAVHYDPGRVTLAQMIEKYEALREDSGRPIAPTSNEWYQLRRFKERLGLIRVSEFSIDDLVAYCQERRREGAGPATVDMDVSKIGTVLRHAGSFMRIMTPDVVGLSRPTLAHLRLIGPANKRHRRPNEDELARLFQYFRAQIGRWGAPMGDIVSLAILIGLRRSEITRIRWEDYDARRRLLLIRQRKHPQRKEFNDQWVPLVGDAPAIIEKQPRKSDRIFPFEGGTLSRNFREACKACGIVDLHLHDSRHEAASALIEAGWTAPEAKMVTGHESSKSLDRYVNLDPAAIAKKSVKKQTS